MTATACLLTASATQVDWLDPLGRVLLWIAFVVWALTAVGLARVLARRLPRGARAGQPSAR